MTVQQLRNAKLHLSQPGNGGWHFFADDGNAQRAAALASAWAQAFALEVQSQVVDPSRGLEQYITASPTQVEDLAADRTVGLSTYLLVGTMVSLALFVLVILFLNIKI